MNLNDTQLLELREQVFQDYRDCTAELKVLQKKYEEDRIQVELTYTDILKKGQKQSELKSLIDIMIEHDCDPVMAKLKYKDMLKEDQDKFGEVCCDQVNYTAIKQASTYGKI